VIDDVKIFSSGKQVMNVGRFYLVFGVQGFFYDGIFWYESRFVAFLH
jgi:hypothetical protein